jgi:hypothetical protein
MVTQVNYLSLCVVKINSKKEIIIRKMPLILAAFYKLAVIRIGI